MRWAWLVLLWAALTPTAPSLAVDQAVGLRFMGLPATPELAATQAVAVTYSFLPEPWDIVLEFQRVETVSLGGAGRQLHSGPLSWTALVVAPRYRFSPFSGPILGRLGPLLGAGLGFYFLDHSLSGGGQQDLVRDCDKLLPQCVTPEEKLSSTVGIHAEAGLDLRLAWGVSVSVEGRWLSFTPDVTITGVPQNVGADPPIGNRTTLSIKRLQQTFLILNALIRYSF